MEVGSSIWFVCQECQRAFATEKYLTKHRQEFHPNEKVEGQGNDPRSLGTNEKWKSHPEEEEIVEIFASIIPRVPVIKHTADFQKQTAGQRPINNERSYENYWSKVSRRVYNPFFQTPPNLMTPSSDLSIVNTFSMTNFSPPTLNAGKSPLAKCEVCGQMWASKKTLQVHMRAHVGQTVFACLFCDKIFSTPGHYRRHMMSHRETPVQCQICLEKFPQKAKLDQHLRTHLKGQTRRVRSEEEGLVECGYCGKKLRSRDYLRVHERIHTGQRPFMCRYCEKTFICFDYRTSHERTHTGERPYPCGHCPARFSTRGSFTRHVKARHT